MIHTHVLNRGPAGVGSLVDVLYSFHGTEPEGRARKTIKHARFTESWLKGAAGKGMTHDDRVFDP